METIKDKIKKVAPLVLQVLREEEETRDDDNLLCASLWARQGAKNSLKFGEFCIMLCDGRFANPETVGRARRKIQETQIDLRGKFYNERHNAELEFRNQIKMDFDF